MGSWWGIRLRQQQGVVVKETDGKKGRWEIGIQTHSNPNFLKSDGHEKI